MKSISLSSYVKDIKKNRFSLHAAGLVGLGDDNGEIRFLNPVFFSSEVWVGIVCPWSKSYPSSQSVPDLRKRLAYVAVSRAVSKLYILAFNEHGGGEFAQKLKGVSGEHWTCDQQGKIAKRVQ